MQPGNVDEQIHLINITHLPKLPIELKQTKNLTINSSDFIFINISNKYTPEKEIFFQIIISQNTLKDLPLNYKFNEENFDEDFINMETIYQSNIYDEKIK